MTDLQLEERDRRDLAGEAGPARQLAMELVVEMAQAVEAPRLLDIESAHIDGCLPFGRVALDLPLRFLEGGGRVVVPTTLNVSALDLLHPEQATGDPTIATLGREIAATYEDLGCQPTWTCAPYQLVERPSFGTHVAWAESNAIVFANSVLGARTSRYGDFFDICAALTGRVPEAGLHVTANRRARSLFRLSGLSARQLASDLLYPLLGVFIGERTGHLIPAITGLPGDVNEDRLKALGAAAASSGSVAMFHAVGITPEAATLEAALQGGEPDLVFDVSAEELRSIRAALRTSAGDGVTAVAVGTPHFSLTEFEQLRILLDGRSIATGMRMYASTGRQTLEQLIERGWSDELGALGVTLVTDTCTYLRPMLDFGQGTVLTNSGKWAWYAPMAVGVQVMLGSLRECVESAVAGRLVPDDGF